MKNGVLLAGVAGVLLLGSVAARPYITLYQIKSAIQNSDGEAFSKLVDFPTLRENFKGQLMASMNKEMGTPDMAGNPMAALGQAMAVALINPMIDAMVSPAGMIAMMQTNKPISSFPGSSKSTSQDSSTTMPDYAVAYQGWDKIVVHNKLSGPEAGGFVFRRNGIWDWKLSGINLPKDKN